MKLKSIKINNYKSFAEENNLMNLEEINTIIGKNEAGKSNLIEAISKLNLTGIKDNNYFENRNKNNGKKPYISLVLCPYEKEKTIYTSDKETIITINNQYEINIEGGLSNIIEQNNEFQNNRKKIKELIGKIYFHDYNKKNQFDTIIKMINNAETKVFIRYSYVDDLVKSLENNPENEEFIEYLKKCINYLDSINSLFPSFICLDNIELKTKYTIQYLKDSQKSKQMLNYFLKTIGMNLNDLTKYWELANDDDKYNFKEEINEKISEVIKGFNKFYNQEKIVFKVDFDKDSLNFVVKTNDKFLNLSERSNGLRWYLNMYIQLIAKTAKSNIENYIVLLDEPGVYLHVNAQKEILKLFEDFILKDNQIIYTTQLPTMIYQDNLYRTRIIIKDDNGNSNIGNKYYTLPHKMSSKQETITPILTAIGMKMEYNFSAMSMDAINIITEGISDYNYIKSFIIQKKTDKKINIIPSTGVCNIHNVISILMGWGYNYKIIIDQDYEGRKEYRELITKLLIDNADIKFVDGTNKESTSDVVIESLFSEEDKQKIGINNDDYKNEKAYYSLEVLKKVENGEYNYTEDTFENFDKLLSEWIN